MSTIHPMSAVLKVCGSPVNTLGKPCNVKVKTRAW